MEGKVKQEVPDPGNKRLKTLALVLTTNESSASAGLRLGLGFGLGLGLGLGLSLLELPVELIEEILSYLSYDEISHLRLVCRMFNRCCAQLLNRGFIRVEKFHGQCLKRVKAQLPRRESERRNHPLARHCDVLSAIETRLSLLGMTYMKYVDMNLCCFIPGKVVDEIYRVLRFIQNNPNPPRVHELLQELRDISSMAMEYFEEKIAPNLKSKLTSPNNIIAAVAAAAMQTPFRGIPVQGSSSSPSYSTPSRSIADRDEEMNKVNQSVKQLEKTLRKEISDWKTKMKETNKLVKEQNQTISEQNARITEQDGRLHDFQRKLTEYDQQLGTTATIATNRSSKKKQPSPEAPVLLPDLSAQNVTTDAVPVPVAAPPERVFTRSQAKLVEPKPEKGVKVNVIDKKSRKISKKRNTPGVRSKK